MKGNTIKSFTTFIKENVNTTKLVDFSSFPSDVLETLQNEYGHYYLNNYDWNTKQDEFIDDGKAFREWGKQNASDEFLKNLNKIIHKIRQDLIVLIKLRCAKKVLADFEDLIKPTLGNEVLVEPLSKYMEYALLHLDNIKDLEEAYQNSKNIIDSDGSINMSKITPSDLFNGDEISLVNFENFAKKNPEYMGVFKDWEKLFNIEIELSLTQLNAFRDTTSYEKIRNLYDYLIQYKSKL